MNDNLELYTYFEMPKIHLEIKKDDLLYEAAFLSREEDNTCEYCLNTTCWD